MSDSLVLNVWRHSRARLAPLLVLQAIADFADNNGHACESVPAISRRSRVSERGVQDAVPVLSALGELIVILGGGPKGVNRYVVTINTSGADIAPVQNLHPAESAPPPQNLHPYTSSTGADSAPVQYLRGADSAPLTPENKGFHAQEAPSDGAESAPVQNLHPADSAPHDLYITNSPRNINTKTEIESICTGADSAPVQILHPAKPEADPNPRRRNPSRLPDGWQPSPSLRGFAEREFPSLDLGIEVERFGDYWRAEASAKARKYDWDAAFRTWLRNAYEFAARRTSAASGRPPATRITDAEARANVRGNIREIIEQGDGF